MSHNFEPTDAEKEMLSHMNDTTKPDTVEGVEELMEEFNKLHTVSIAIQSGMMVGNNTPEESAEAFERLENWVRTTLLSERAKAEESKKRLVELVGATCTACKNKLQLKHDTKEL